MKAKFEHRKQHITPLVMQRQLFVAYFVSEWINL